MKTPQRMIAMKPKLKQRFDGLMIERKFKKRTRFLEYLLDKDEGK